MGLPLFTYNVVTFVILAHPLERGMALIPYLEMLLRVAPIGLVETVRAWAAKYPKHMREFRCSGDAALPSATVPTI